MEEPKVGAHSLHAVERCGALSSSSNTRTDWAGCDAWLRNRLFQEGW